MSTEDALLKARIAALTNRLNAMKHDEYANYFPYGTWSHAASQGLARGRGRRGASPYMLPPGRISKAPITIHRNRTLVMNTATWNKPSPDDQNEPGWSENSTMKSWSRPNDISIYEQDEEKGDSTGTSWVSKRDRHMQLINSNVYEQKKNQRIMEVKATEEKNQDLRCKSDMSRLNQYICPQPVSSGKETHLDIGGIKFKLQGKGNKLVRLAKPTEDESVNPLTPRSVKLGGVEFIRSKNGNLLRATLVHDQMIRRTSGETKSGLCPRFTSTGVCARGSRCRFLHDPTKVAICKEFLSKGTCSAGDGCDLSHELEATRVPVCTHFLRGQCAKGNCRYVHVKVSAAAKVCVAFGQLGYCEKGINCEDRHVVECPFYSNGSCQNARCHMPHIDRAGKIRKAAGLGNGASIVNANGGTVDDGDHVAAVTGEDFAHRIGEDEIAIKSDSDPGDGWRTSRRFLMEGQPYSGSRDEGTGNEETEEDVDSDEIESEDEDSACDEQLDFIRL